MRYLKIYLQILDRLFPSLAVKKIYKFLSNPQVRKLRAFEDEILDQAVKKQVTHNKAILQSYTWGNPNDPLIYLVHGWEGQAGNFGALISILLKKGYYIKAFDAPAHGYSPKVATSMFAFAEFLEHMIAQERPEYFISHSFGTVSSLMAIENNPEVPIKKLIAITTPNNFKNRLGQVQSFLGISDRTMNKVIKLLEEGTGQKFENMNIKHLSTKVNHIKDILIVHSKSDKIIPIEWAREANQDLPQSKMIELDGLGHYSILWSDALKEVVEQELEVIHMPISPSV